MVIDRCTRASISGPKNVLVGLTTLVLAGCSATTNEVSESTGSEASEVELLARFPINSEDRYPRRVHDELALDGTMPFENGYFPPHIPLGPIEMDCSVVDEFGVTFKYLWAERYDYPRRNIELTISHPELDTDNWRFQRFTRPPRRAAYRPRVYTWSFELEDRFRRNGTYTLDVTYGDRTLLQTRFLMTGCESDS